MTSGFLATFAAAASLLFAADAPHIDVVVGPQSSELERHAAREISSQFSQLFDAEVAVHDAVPANAKNLILVGSPASNPAVKQHVSNWPKKLSDQGIVVRSFNGKDASGVVVGGGSPVATLWAAYELGYQFGVRYSLHVDVIPDTKGELKLGEFDIVREPVFPVRAWRTVNDFPIGFESWSAEDQQKVFAQLAKQKFNRILISVYAWQPFVDFEAGGVKKSTAMLWYGEKYPIQRDTPGKVAFNGAAIFENPDFAGKEGYDELTAAGVKHVRHLISSAHDLGMSVALQMSPLEFTREFAEVIPGAKDSPSPNNVLIAPGKKQGLDDKALKELVAAQIRAYIETYPELDALYLTLPEFPEWEAHAEEAWKRLSTKHDLGDATLESHTEAAENRHTIASGKRGREALRGNVAALAFLSDLLSDGKLLQREDGKSVELVFVQLDPALYPIADKILPKSSGMLNLVDYTARRVVENRELLKDVPAKKVPSQFIFTLADDNIGIIPQIATQRIETIARDLVEQGWQGFTTRMWVPAYLDLTVHFLSRFSFDTSTTARSAHDEFFLALTEQQSSTDRLWLSFEQLEAATEIIDKNDIGFAFPVPNMLMKHYTSEPVPEWWTETLNAYVAFLTEMYRGGSNTAPHGYNFIFYFSKRSEFPLEYLTAVQAVREAAIAEKEGDLETASEKLNAALESIFNAMDILSDIGHDQSDRAIIAVLDAYAFRPLQKEIERIDEAIAAKSGDQ